ncbi:hypothetical protein O181_052468 [Austropuccinia psidii MF-1]|uniref:Secreted protein n=1 Tax=Austropuccinia psidii MF-1 TaxID=1389203 RepID=A0A9Q3HPE5_9BASI|nr:hypothetical protein [Austropuccinia psidii MF-1]
MFFKGFGFQILLLALAFALTSAQQEPPNTSSQVCTDGLHPAKEAEKLLCDTVEKTYLCTSQSCHVKVNNKNMRLENYVFTGCIPVSYGLPPLHVLHPTDFAISTDRLVYYVKDGWYFKNKNENVKESIAGVYKCIIASSVSNKVNAHCHSCTPKNP